jgi:2-haloacid dehalogenase/putative hydrolase of the HAD superfamily
MAIDTTWPRAILLDFYGTVVEEDHAPIATICDQIARASSRDVTASEISAFWGRRFGELCAQSHGRAFRSQREVERISLQDVLQHFDADLDGERLNQVLYDYWVRPSLYPESRSVVSQCKRPVCLVSNIDEVDLRSALEHTGLTFEHIITSDGCRAYKPRPEPFMSALSLLGLSSHEVLHVGDSLRSDVRGARALSIPVLWINRRNRALPPGHEPPDYVSADLTGLIDVLRAASRGVAHHG